MPPLILRAQKTKADILTFSTELWISVYVATQNDTSYLCKPPLLFRGQAQAHASHEGQLRLPREEPQNCCWCCAPNLSAGLSSAQHKWLEGHVPKQYTREQAARSRTRLCANSIGRQHVAPPACGSVTSGDADVQSLFAKTPTAAPGPWVVHQMFTCTDRCLCWSSWFNAHYITYQAADGIISAKTRQQRRLEYKIDSLVVWGHYTPGCILLLNQIEQLYRSFNSLEFCMEKSLSVSEGWFHSSFGHHRMNERY